MNFKLQLNWVKMRRGYSQLLLVVLLYNFVHALDSSCSGQSLFICVAGRRSILCGDCSAIFTLSPTLYFPLFISVMGTFFTGLWGLMAGLSGFVRHWCSLHLWAGCQLWKLQDVLGTQPPLSSADMKFNLTWRQSPFFSLYRFSEFLVKKNTKTFQGTGLMDLLLMIIFFLYDRYVDMYFFLQHLSRSWKIWKVETFHFRIVLKIVYMTWKKFVK